MEDCKAIFCSIHIGLHHLKRHRSLVVVDALTVEEEGQRGDGNPNCLTVGPLQFLHFRGSMHPEVCRAIVLVEDFQLDVLGLVTSHLGIDQLCNMGFFCILLVSGFAHALALFSISPMFCYIFLPLPIFINIVHLHMLS